MTEHERCMHRCLELAMSAGKKGNTPVGALILLEGRVVAEAEEEVCCGLDPTAHAESLVIRQVCQVVGNH